MTKIINTEGSRGRKGGKREREKEKLRKMFLHLSDKGEKKKNSPCL